MPTNLIERMVKVVRILEVISTTSLKDSLTKSGEGERTLKQLTMWRMENKKNFNIKIDCSLPKIT